jgi:hypothetical protein
MPDGALDVRIRRNHERIELARLTRTLTDVRLALAEIDHVYLLRGQRPKWVVDMVRDQKEYLLVRLAAGFTPRRDSQSLFLPPSALVAGVESLNRLPEVPPYYTETTVERLIKIGEPGQGVTEVSLATVNGHVNDYISVSEPVRQHAQEAVRGAEVSLGSVAGWLDQMNARRAGKGILVVGLFDSLTRRAVTGHVPAAMEPQVQALWRRRVLAHGSVTRNERGQIVRIRIERFELLPENDDERAPVSELLGIDRSWTGAQSVDEYVREARRA